MPTKKSATKSTAKKPATAAAASAAVTEKAVTEAIEPVETAFAANQETMETVLKAGSQAATKGYEQAIALAQEQVEKASETLFKRYDDFAGLGKDNVDAYVRSTAALTKGIESLNKELMSIAQSAVEANVATTKALFGATTLRELVDLQTEFSRSRFDSAVAESAKLTEMTMALANDAIEPIQISMNATVEKFMKPVAA
ncbi:phasin family protein [Pelagibius sp. 7325]|uniref:phasin family protein n=1 Tax=Pelagibius sp. 7325 TaxID=3131994 RepID=UPI0030EB7928